MKCKNILLSAAAGMLILSAGAGSTWAYFTTYTEARGGYPIQLGSQSRVEEEVGEWTKHVTVSNDENSSQPVYIRVKAFSGSQYALTYSSSGAWSPGEDGYYYYSGIVEPGGTTEVLDIKIEGVPADAKEGDSFNVVVIYESTPVCYQEDGIPYADWSMILDNGTTEGGVTE